MIDIPTDRTITTTVTGVYERCPICHCPQPDPGTTITAAEQPTVRTAGPLVFVMPHEAGCAVTR